MGVATESGARRCLSARHPNLLQRVLTVHLLMLNRPCPHRPPMCSSSGTALRQDPLWPQTLHRFPPPPRGTADPLGGAGGGGGQRCDPCGALGDPTGPGGYRNAKRYYFPGAEAEA